MFKAIKEFFLGKPAEPVKEAEAPYKVEAPVVEAKVEAPVPVVEAPVAEAKKEPAKKPRKPRAPKAGSAKAPKKSKK